MRPALAALALIGLSVGARAEQAGNWPCMQRKVPEISLVAVWTGPAIDPQLKAWQQDREVKDLVDRLKQRRTPLDEAERLVKVFSQANGAEKIIAVFAGLFETLNAERKDVIAGIERYGAKQKLLAERIRTTEADATKAKGDQAKYDELNDQLTWDLRIFDERQKSLSYVCEVPQLIERRLFDLGRTIEAAIKARP